MPTHGQLPRSALSSTCGPGRRGQAAKRAPQSAGSRGPPGMAGAGSGVQDENHTLLAHNRPQRTSKSHQSGTGGTWALTLNTSSSLSRKDHQPRTLHPGTRSGSLRVSSTPHRQGAGRGQQQAGQEIHKYSKINTLLSNSFITEEIPGKLELKKSACLWVWTHCASPAPSLTQAWEELSGPKGKGLSLRPSEPACQGDGVSDVHVHLADAPHREEGQHRGGQGGRPWPRKTPGPAR